MWFLLLTDLSFLSFLQGDNQVYWFQTSSITIFALTNGCSSLSLSLASITTWWWLLQPPRRPPPLRIMTCCSTVSSRTAPRRCCGSSRARLEAARWPPQTGAATAEAPAAWCRPAACGTGTETESETGTATPSQDCRGPRWKPRRQPFTAPYLTLSPLTRTQSELKDEGDLNNGSTCK